MAIQIIYVGKTKHTFVANGVDHYIQRLKKYQPVQFIEIPNVKHRKSLSIGEIKAQEASLVDKYVDRQDMLLLLDEKGKKYSSQAFAKYLERIQNLGFKKINFVIGGAYGFHEDLRKNAHGLISLSDMTFAHGLARLLFVEQLYRAFSILHGDPYHNE